MVSLIGVSFHIYILIVRNEVKVFKAEHICVDYWDAFYKGGT